MTDHFTLSSIQKPRLLEQVRGVLRFQHYSIRTEESYLQWIKRFIYFHNKRHLRWAYNVTLAVNEDQSPLMACVWVWVFYINQGRQG